MRMDYLNWRVSCNAMGETKFVLRETDYDKESQERKPEFLRGCMNEC